MVQGQTVLCVWPAMKYYSYQSKVNVNVNEVILMYPLVYYNFTIITIIADLQCLNKIIKNFIQIFHISTKHDLFTSKSVNRI